MINGFLLYNGDLMGLAVNKNHLVFIWNDPTCKILFSIVKRGQVALCHFASDKRGLRKIKTAIDDFCKFCFTQPWCEFIMGFVKAKSVMRTLNQCGFEHIADFEDNKILSKRKS